MQISRRALGRGLRFLPLLALLTTLAPAPASAGFGDWVKGVGNTLVDTGKSWVDSGKKKMGGGLVDKVLGAGQVAGGAVTNGTGKVLTWMGDLFGAKQPAPAAPAPRPKPAAPAPPPPRPVIPSPPPPKGLPVVAKTPASTAEKKPTGKEPGTQLPGGTDPFRRPPGADDGARPKGGGGDGGSDFRPPGPATAKNQDFDGSNPGSFDLARGPGGGYAAGDPAGPGAGHKMGRDSKIPDVGGGREYCKNDPSCGDGRRNFGGPSAQGDGASGGSASLGSLLSSRDLPPGFKHGLGEAGALDGLGKTREPELSPEGMAAALAGEGARSRLPGGGGGGFGDKISMLRDKEGADSPAAKAAALLQTAEEHLQARQWDEAIWALDQAIELMPNNPQLWVKRSTAKNMKGDYEGAERDAREALRLNPDDPEAWVNLAWAQLRTGRYQDALDSATRAIALDPKNALAYSIRAYASEALGDDSGKMSDIKMAARLDPRYQDQYERGLNGGKIYNPDADYAPFFLNRGERAPLGPGPGMVILGLLLLCGASVAGARWFEIRTGRTLLPWWPRKRTSPVTIQVRTPS